MIIKLGKLELKIGGKKLEVKGDSIKVDGKDVKLPPICSICGCDARTCMHAGKVDDMGEGYDTLGTSSMPNKFPPLAGSLKSMYMGVDVANGDSNNIVIVNGQVVGGKSKYNLIIFAENDLKEVKADGSVTVNGNVGDIDCGGSVTVKGTAGDIDCGGSANIGGNAGDIDAGGSVRTGK